MDPLERLPDCIDRLAALLRGFRGYYAPPRLLGPSEYREVAIAQAIQLCLDETALCFTELVGERCVTSMMAYDPDPNRPALMTVAYSKNAPSERTREDRHNTVLVRPRGIAWRIMTTRKAEVIADLSADPDWITGAPDWAEYYRSAVIAYYSSGDEPLGVLNIDCLKLNAFPKWTVHIAKMVAEVIGFACQMDEVIRTTDFSEENNAGGDNEEDME